MIITFCGHSKFNGTQNHKNTILHLLERYVGNDPCEIYLGGYGDFDNFSYECAKEYQMSHTNVSLVLITPYLRISHFEELHKKYDSVIYPEIEDKPLKFAIYYRNRWMIQKCDVLICFISHTWGGAYQTYQYAKHLKKLAINIADRYN